jgi:hypothetical protein
MDTTGSTAATRRGRRLRIPPNLFGIPFGISGVADVWSTAASTLGISTAVPDAIDILAAAIWVVVVGLYFSQGPARLKADVRDPVLAPFVALSAIAPILSAVTLSNYARPCRRPSSRPSRSRRRPTRSSARSPLLARRPWASNSLPWPAST